MNRSAQALCKDVCHRKEMAEPQYFRIIRHTAQNSASYPLKLWLLDQDLRQASLENRCEYFFPSNKLSRWTDLSCKNLERVSMPDTLFMAVFLKSRVFASIQKNKTTKIGKNQKVLYALIARKLFLVQPYFPSITLEEVLSIYLNKIKLFCTI